jgi:hypothetical protein
MSDSPAILADIERLAKKTGLSVASLPPDERDLLLTAFRQHFCRLPFPVSERPFSAYIADWLAALTGLIRTDVAEFRRTLVDFRFVSRDTSGLAYVPSASAPGEKGEFVAGGGELNLTQALIEARAVELAARETRRRRHAAA